MVKPGSQAKLTSPVSPTNATYAEPSAERILEPGVKLGDLLQRNMTQPYGDMYGFDDATPPNAEMVAWAMFEYR